MIRALIEFIFFIVFAWAARAILRTLLGGFSQVVKGPQNSSESGRPNAPLKGADLHKDPVCGTYVVESTRFQREIGGQRFYYCSEECQGKHELVSK